MLVRDGATLPGNVSGIPVTLAASADAVKGQIKLTTAGGATIETKLVYPAQNGSDYPLVVPVSPFVPGEYSLEIPNWSSPVHSSFTVAEKAALPTPAIKVTVGNAGHGTAAVAGGAACVDNVDASVLDVTVSVAEDYRPYRELIMFNGTKSAPDAFFWTLPAGASPFGAPATGIPDSLSVTYRVGRPCSKDGGKGTGKVTFTVEVPGVENVTAEATADLDFAACDTLSPATAPGAVSGNGGAADGGANGANGGTATSGCSASGSDAPAQSAGLTFAAFAVVAMAMRRRRRGA